MARSSKKRPQRSMSIAAEVHFRDIAEMYQTITTTPSRDNWGCSKVETKYAKNNNFAGMPYAEALRRMSEGDEVTAAKISAEGDIKPLPTQTTRRIYASVVGCVPNVPAYIIGVPKQMLAIKKERGGGSSVRIFLNIGYHCGYRAEDAARAGNVVANMVTQLEQRNIRVALSTIYASQDSEKRVFFNQVDLKDEDAPLDLLACAFAFHPAFMRIGSLRWLQTVSDYIFGHGSPVSSADIERLLPQRFACEHLSLSVADIVDNNQTSEELVAEVQEYIEHLNELDV